MPTPVTRILRYPVSTNDTTKAKRVRDLLISGSTDYGIVADNDGVRCLIDIGFNYCYPGGTYAGRSAPGAPAYGATVYDVAMRANGAVRKASGQTIAYSGGGLDFASCTSRGNYIEVPASVAADLFAAAPAGAASVGSSQYFAIGDYVKWPNTSGWSDVSAGSYYPLFNWCGSVASPNAYYATTPEIVFFGLKPDGSVQASFQTALNVVTSLQMGSSTANVHRGLLTQILAWRNASGIGIRLKSSAGTNVVTAALNSANTADYSAAAGKFGIGNSIWPSSGMSASANHRHYRLWIENLARSGRDPLAVADFDWAITAKRIAASAAANGGTSLIFA